MNEGRIDEQQVKQAWDKVQQVMCEAAEAINASPTKQIRDDNCLRLFIAIRALKDACKGDRNLLKQYGLSPVIQALALNKQNDYFYMGLYPAAAGFKKHAESFTKKQAAEKTEFEDISKWGRAVFDKVFEPLISTFQNRENVSIQAQDLQTREQYREAWQAVSYYRESVANQLPDKDIAKAYQQSGRTTQETLLQAKPAKLKLRELAKEKLEKAQQRIEEVRDDVRERLTETKFALKGKLKRSSAPSESIALTRTEIQAAKFDGNLESLALTPQEIEAAKFGDEAAFMAESDQPGNEIMAVSGTYREIYTAFGLDVLIDTKTQDDNLDAIAKDIARTPFLSQHEGDFERFAQQWIEFNSSCYGQGDVKGSELAAIQNDMVPMKYGKADDMAAIREASHQSSFGYLDETSGKPSGISCYVARDPEDPSFHYWIISIMHNATGSPDERQMHVITNLPRRAVSEPIFQAEKQPQLQSHIVENREALVGFLKENVHSAPVVSLLENSITEDCTFREEPNQKEFFTQRALQEVGYSQHDLMIVSPEGFGDYGPKEAKADAERKLAELRHEPTVVQNTVDDAILSLWRDVINAMKSADDNKMDYLPLLLAAEKLLRAIDPDGKANPQHIDEMLAQLAAVADLSEKDVSHTFCYEMSNMLAGIQQTVMFPHLDKVIHAVKPFTQLDSNQMARYLRDAENNANSEVGEQYQKLNRLFVLVYESPRKFYQALKTYSVRDLADYIEAHPDSANKIFEKNPVMLARFMGNPEAFEKVLAARPDVLTLCRDPFTVSMDNGFANVRAAYQALRHTPIDKIVELIAKHPDSGLAEMVLKQRRGTKLPWRKRNFREEICRDPDLLGMLVGTESAHLKKVIEEVKLLDSRHVDSEIRSQFKTALRTGSIEIGLNKVEAEGQLALAVEALMNDANSGKSKFADNPFIQLLAKYPDFLLDIFDNEDLCRQAQESQLLRKIIVQYKEDASGAEKFMAEHPDNIRDLRNREFQLQKAIAKLKKMVGEEGVKNEEALLKEAVYIRISKTPEKHKPPQEREMEASWKSNEGKVPSPPPSSVLPLSLSSADEAVRDSEQTAEAEGIIEALMPRRNMPVPPPTSEPEKNVHVEETQLLKNELDAIMQDLGAQMAQLEQEMKGILDDAEVVRAARQDCRAVLQEKSRDKLITLLLQVFDEAKDINEFPSPEKMQQFVDEVQKIDDYAEFKALLVKSDGMFLRLFNGIPQAEIEKTLKGKAQNVQQKASEIESLKEVSKEQHRIK